MPRHDRRYAYGPYTDGPDPLAPPVDLRAALDAVGRDVMEGSSPRAALRELLRRGVEGRRGLDDLTRQVWQRRSRLQRDNRLDGTLQEVRELLARALEAERDRPGQRGLRRRPLPRDAARRAAVGHRRRRPRARLLRLALRRGPRGLPGDPRPARPGAARPALRRHEAGDAERHPRRRRAHPRDARRPELPAREPRAGAEHRAAVRRVHAPATASSSRRTRRTPTSWSTCWPSGPRPPSGCSTR